MVDGDGGDGVRAALVGMRRFSSVKQLIRSCFVGRHWKSISQSLYVFVFNPFRWRFYLLIAKYSVIIVDVLKRL